MKAVRIFARLLDVDSRRSLRPLGTRRRHKNYALVRRILAEGPGFIFDNKKGEKIKNHGKSLVRPVRLFPFLGHT